VLLPFHLRNLAGAGGEVQLQVAPPVTLQSVLETLETKYPVLRGTIRDHGTHKRRPFIRFFACERDISLDPSDALLPESIAGGQEPLQIVGAIAGG
jgi:hypothetical protein